MISRPENSLFPGDDKHQFETTSFALLSQAFYADIIYEGLYCEGKFLKSLSLRYTHLLPEP